MSNKLDFITKVKNSDNVIQGHQSKTIYNKLID